MMLTTTTPFLRPSFSHILGPALSRCIATATTSVPVASYSIKTEGQTLTDKYRVFFTAQPSGKIISPWHDIPLWTRPMENWNVTGGVHCNYVAEISRGTRAKMEVATKEAHNPIRQDTRKGKLRFYGKDPCFNYGLLPQTWEDPSVQDPETKLFGDRDPMDLVELSERPLPTGTVTEVKVLGCFCLLDQGEVDWKVLAIDTDNAWSKRLHSLADVDTYMPGRIEEIMEWFCTYKVDAFSIPPAMSYYVQMLEGKPRNQIGYDGKALSLEKAREIIVAAHDHWKGLLKTGGEYWVPDSVQCAADKIGA